MRARTPAAMLCLVVLARPGLAEADAKEAAAAREKLVRECDASEKDFESSHSTRLLPTLGLCGLQLERDGEAIAAYSRYLAEVNGLDPKDRELVATHLQDLEVRVARLRLHTGRAGVQVVDVRVPARGERITNEYGPTEDDGVLELAIRPGHHILTTKLAGFEDEIWELDVGAGAREGHSFVLAPIKIFVPPPAKPGRGAIYGPWLVAGLGGAMLIAGTITGIATLDKRDRIDDRCPSGFCPSSFDLEGERSSGKTLAATTDVLLIGGGLAVLGGLGWYAFGSARRGIASSSSRFGPFASAPTAMCSPTGCSATLRLAF